MNDWLHLVLVTLLTNIGVGAVWASLLLQRRNELGLGRTVIVIIGLGLAPWSVSWCLNILLLLLPGLPHGAVLGVVLGFFLLLGVLGRHGWKELLEWIKERPAMLRSTDFMSFLFITAIMAVGALMLLTFKPLADHDILEYGTQGRIFLRDMAVHYERHHYDPISGFYYVGLHGFSFPLLFTWEGLFGPTTDIWVRSMTPWYVWLLVALIWSTMRSVGPWAPLWTLALMGSTLAFIYMDLIYHVDPLRVFFFTASMLLFVQLIQTPSIATALVLGVLLGAHAHLHSLGMILGCLMCGVLLVVNWASIASRIRWVLVAGVPFMLAGGAHYIVDMLYGTGWLLKDITWF